MTSKKTKKNKKKQKTQGQQIQTKDQIQIFKSSLKKIQVY